jgi:hypothetical protein
MDDWQVDAIDGQDLKHTAAGMDAAHTGSDIQENHHRRDALRQRHARMSAKTPRRQPIAGMRILCVAAEQGPNIIF